jgi:adenylate cyclase
VIYSFKARDDYAPIFVSGNIERLLGYSPDEYLKNADFWRERVHPDDLAGIEAKQTKLFEAGQHTTNTASGRRTAPIAGSATSSM